MAPSRWCTLARRVLGKSSAPSWRSYRAIEILPARRRRVEPLEGFERPLVHRQIEDLLVDRDGPGAVLKLFVRQRRPLEEQSLALLVGVRDLRPPLENVEQGGWLVQLLVERRERLQRTPVIGTDLQRLAIELEGELAIRELYPSERRDLQRDVELLVLGRDVRDDVLQQVDERTVALRLRRETLGPSEPVREVGIRRRVTQPSRRVLERLARIAQRSLGHVRSLSVDGELLAR